MSDRAFVPLVYICCPAEWDYDNVLATYAAARFDVSVQSARIRLFQLGMDHESVMRKKGFAI